jgi:hypothetical protein
LLFLDPAILPTNIGWRWVSRSAAFSGSASCSCDGTFLRVRAEALWARHRGGPRSPVVASAIGGPDFPQQVVCKDFADEQRLQDDINIERQDGTIPVRLHLPSTRNCISLKPTFAAVGAFMLNPWLALTFKTMQLGLDAQNVIALRMLRLATGDVGAQNEARVVTDEIKAAAEVQEPEISAIMTDRKDTVVADKVLRVSKRRVRANKRRLSRR